MPDHFFKKALGNTLVPSTEDARKWLAGVKVGEVLRIKASRPRNIKHHQKFFALLQLIYENQEHYKSVNQILLAFKCHIGHGEWVISKKPMAYRPDGSVSGWTPIELFEPHSISFAKMDQGEFEAFYDKAVDFVTTVVIPGLPKGDLEQQLLEFAA